MVRSELLQGLCNHHPSLVRKDLEKFFTGPTAAAISSDPITSAKILANDS